MKTIEACSTLLNTSFGTFEHNKADASIRRKKQLLSRFDLLLD
jgi:hypothetical protein